jgi:hypothetical protein
VARPGRSGAGVAVGDCGVSGREACAELWDMTKQFGGFGPLLFFMGGFFMGFLPDDFPDSVAVLIGMVGFLVVMITVFTPINVIWIVCGICKVVYDLARWLFQRFAT